ncbi:hypothetical protein D7V86_08170 [bacterium D16-51]|nr:hypothetical protein D7V96_08155 [bacterium D16-59]RKI60574.1 hypothetical protein D7V86_08170 [bacterium D16-51]
MDGKLNILETEGSKTILSLEDMAALVAMYDAIKRLNITLTGGIEIHAKKNGVLGVLESIYGIIDNGVCQEIRSLEEEEFSNTVNYILDNDDETPINRAKQLLGIY